MKGLAFQLEGDLQSLSTFLEEVICDCTAGFHFEVLCTLILYGTAFILMKFNLWCSIVFTKVIDWIIDVTTLDTLVELYS